MFAFPREGDLFMAMELSWAGGYLGSQALCLGGNLGSPARFPVSAILEGPDVAPHAFFTPTLPRLRVG